MRQKRARAVLMLGLIAIAVGLAPARAVSAHAVFISAAPAPGQTLSQTPSRIHILFSEPLNGPLSGVDLYRSTGAEIEALSHGVDPADPRAYVATLSPLQPDRYTALWHTVSLVDGHSRRGSYTFTVLESNGAPPPVKAASIAASAPRQTPQAFDAAAKWLALIGLFLTTGPLLLDLLSIGPEVEPDFSIRPHNSRTGAPAGESVGGDSPVESRLLALSGAGTLLLLVGSAGQLFGVWLPAGGPGSAGAVLLSRFGLWWLARLAAALLFLATVLLQSTRLHAMRASASADLGQRVSVSGPGKVRTAAGAVSLGIVALSFAMTSHGAASDRAVWGVAFDCVHLLAAAVWIGGLAALAVLVLAPGKSPDGRPRLNRLLRRFSVAAGIAVPAVLISGAGSAVIELAKPSDLVQTDYGRALLAKALLVLAVLSVAVANAFWFRSGFIRGGARGVRIRQTILVEALVGVAVLVPAALMTVQTPARAEDDARTQARALSADADPANLFQGNTAVGGLAVALTITPGAEGTNQARVELNGALPVATIRLAFTGPDHETLSIPLPRAGLSQDAGVPHTIFAGPLQIPDDAGAWHLSVTLPGVATPSPPLLVPIATAPSGLSIGLATPGERWMVVIALALCGGAVAALARALRTIRGRVLALSLGTISVASALGLGTALAMGSGTRAAPWGVATQVRPVTTGAVQAWRIPTPESGLMIPAVGPDGSVWIAEMDANKLARLTPATDTVREFDFPGAVQSAMGVAVDSSGAIWIAQEDANAIGRFEPATGKYTAYQVPTPRAAPSGIALGSDGDIWFTELSANKIGRFEPASGAFTEFEIPSSDSAPYWLAPAPDGRVWFSELSGKRLGVVDPATRQVREYPLTADRSPTGIAVQADGSVWAATTQGVLMRLEPATGAVTSFPAPETGLYGLATGRDGRLWIGSANGSAALSFNPLTSHFQLYQLGAGGGPWWPAIGPSGDVWFALAANSANSLAMLRNGH